MALLLLAFIAAPLLVTAFFVVEIVAGLVPERRSALRGAAPTEIVIVMPAHDEAAIIEATITRLAPAIAGWARLLVVADNCEDDTATIARASGAEVIERFNRERRGKGFALDFAREHLRSAPPAAVIVFDADCWSDRASLQALAHDAISSRRPCQAVYLIAPTPTAPAMVQVSSFAFMIKNLVRQRGLQRLAGHVHLTGTGMGFPWSLFAAAPLASPSIVEDLELGRALAEAGHPPMLVQSAIVWSRPSAPAGTLVQRRRWEGGFLAVARDQAPRALASALRRGNLRGLAAGIDLLVPPLTLLALVDAAALALAAVITLVTGAAWWPVLLLLVTSAAAALAIAAAWGREGREFLSSGALLRMPLYVLWKIPLYLGLAKGTPSEWLRPGR